MTFHFPVKLHKGNAAAMVMARSVSHLPTAGVNCDCVSILSEQVASQMPGLYLFDGRAWRFALDKAQIDISVIFGYAIEIYYQLDQEVDITVPAKIFRNSLQIAGTKLDPGSTAVYAVELMPDSTDPSNWAPIFSPDFQGTPTAPTPAQGNDSDQLATTAFVMREIRGLPATGVVTFNQRAGDITLLDSDIIQALGYTPVDPANAAFSGTPTAPTPLAGDSSTKLATTEFVMTAVQGMQGGVTSFNTRKGDITLLLQDITAAGGAPIDSPDFLGTPTAPTQLPGDSTTKLATTEFVMAAVTSSVSGVASFNTRTGAVTLTLQDVTDALGYTPQDAASAVTEAPVDGKIYGRKDLAWAEINVPSTALGPLTSVLGPGAMSVIQDDGTGTGIAILKAFQDSPSVTVHDNNGLISFESMSIISVNGVTPVNGDVTLTPSNIGALALAGGTMLGDINMGGKTVTGLADPVNGSDAVTLNSLGLTTYDPGEY